MWPSVAHSFSMDPMFTPGASYSALCCAYLLYRSDAHIRRILWGLLLRTASFEDEEWDEKKDEDDGKNENEEEEEEEEGDKLEESPRR